RREHLLNQFTMVALATFLRNTYRMLSVGGSASGSASLGRRAVVLILSVATGAWPIPARAQNVTFKIPPVKIPLKIKEQTITITASGVVSVHSKDKDSSVFKLELNAD